MVGHGQVLSGVGGEHHEAASPSGVVMSSEVLVEGGDAVGAQAAGERDERGVGEAERRADGGRSRASRRARRPTSARV